MEFSVEVEKPSSIVRKMTIKVPAKEVKDRFNRGLATVQKTANLKGFRPGQAPMNIIKQYYGEDVRHRVFHNLIDESFEKAVEQEKFKAVGSPKIDTSHHQTGEGAHDHHLHEDQDLMFTATFEVMPELRVKGYTGLSLTQDRVEVNDEHVEKVIQNLQNSQAELVNVGGGLALADGTESSRPAQKGDYVDVVFSGGLVTEAGVQPREDMKGSRVIEIGAGGWIPGFEEEFIGMRRTETKTFRLTFPKDYSAAELADQQAEFTVTLNELKEKKVPVVDEEFSKQLGYESLEDLRGKARGFLVKEKTEDSERKIKSDLLAKVIEKNPFDVPTALIEGQTRALAQDWAQELKKQGYDEQLIQNAISQDLDSLKKRAESQVRASLILEAIADAESIAVSPEELDEEISKLAEGAKIDKMKLEDYYAKNSGRRADLEFRLRQERTLKFLLGKSKIKEVEPSKEA